jgi:hypothetical protein
MNGRLQNASMQTSFISAELAKEKKIVATCWCFEVYSPYSI